MQLPSASVARDEILAAVRRLETARASGFACPPVRDLIGAHDLQAAYAVQRELTERRLAGGARAIGHKIGLTSPAVQAQLGVDQPDFGVLFDDMQYAEADLVPMTGLLQPRIEAEVAFVLAEDLDEGDLGLDQIRAAVDHVVAALEIVDSRVQDWDISFADTVADNASAGAFVLGQQRVTLSEVSLREVQMTMRVTGQDESTGDGSACLGDPLLAVQWLARQARELGDPLRAGHIILSGALGPMRAVRPGATAVADITGLGRVHARFAGVDQVADRAGTTAEEQHR
ncbi:putative hydratase/decarboxylase [Acrocarpospora pleiomorpha]|uniref:Putative hydratase/decarboxylase n=1 Tax=Acrocarpospora pleiomorpha TaxID=90975 RepID=A0A5M3X746_9ACTN|nr:fumarylacetoacetate hydrolase family protein [Acrocarpospora pleiomorpha]GES17505.1 putative hydratase/decarboxylase [Acrocarpospora pleiomorpha]